MRGEFIDVAGTRIYYYAAGSRGAGDPIVLVHGFPTSGHVWGDLVSLLPAGRRVVVPDLPGHGRSDAGRAVDLSIDGHARSLAGLLDALRIERASLVGHHAGALVAGSLARWQPGRVAHLAMLNPIGGDVALTGTFAVLRAFLPLVRLLPPALVRRWIRRELCRWYGDPGRGRMSVNQYLLALTDAAHWGAFLRQLQALDVADVTRHTESLRGLSLPVAIVAGADDPAAPPSAVARLRGVLPHATLDIVRDGRHFTPEESPEQVARSIARLVAGGTPEAAGP